MLYEDKGLGFSFELSEGWNQSKHIKNPSYMPTRFFTSNIGMIEIMVGEVEDALVRAEARKKNFEPYLKNMGFSNLQISLDKNLGDETNVIFTEYNAGNRKECMISTVYKERHVLIRYEGNIDETAKNNIDQLMKSFKFFDMDPTTKKASMEEAKISASMIAKDKRIIGNQARTSKKWWQFWK